VQSYVIKAVMQHKYSIIFITDLLIYKLKKKRKKRKLFYSQTCYTELLLLIDKNDVDSLFFLNFLYLFEIFFTSFLRSIQEKILYGGLKIKTTL